MGICLCRRKTDETDYQPKLPKVQQIELPNYFGQKVEEDYQKQNEMPKLCVEKRLEILKKHIDSEGSGTTKEPIPKIIIESLKDAFTDKAESLARIIFFLSSSQAKGEAAPFIDSLQNVICLPDVFKKVAERMEEDTQKVENDPSFRQVMHDVWINFMKDNLSENSDDGQRFQLALPGNVTSAVVQYNFMHSIAHLPPHCFETLQTFVARIGGAGPLATVGNRALNVARSTGPLLRVALVGVYLAYEVIMNIRRWWKGEISGKRCVKNIIDCGVGVAAGIAGGLAGEAIGAAIGTFVAGPIGTVVGAVVGGAVGGTASSIGAKALCDKLTQWIFGLPKNEALENAYNFLKVPTSASNTEINSQYRKLALKYHPDKDGDRDMWTKLQYHMAVIREARGEP